MGEISGDEFSKRAPGVLQQLYAHAYDNCVVSSKFSSARVQLTLVKLCTSH